MNNPIALRKAKIAYNLAFLSATGLKGLIFGALNFSVQVFFRVYLFLCPRSNNKKITKANLMKLHRKIEHNEKVCNAQELGSYAQGQGHNQVRGQIVPKIVLLIN